MLKRLEGINLDELKALSESHEPLPYNKLCERLNIRVKSGNSKGPQLEDLEAICDFHVEENPTRYIIDKYYDGALPVLESMKGKYTPYIEAILCSRLMNEDTIYVTTRQLAEMVSLANINFFVALNYKNRLPISLENKYDVLSLDKFLEETYDNAIRPIVRDALASMERRYIIVQNKAYRYMKKDDNIWCYCEANSELGKKFLEVENIVREELRLGDRKYLTRDEWNEFYRRCDICGLQLLGVKTFSRCKQIISKKEIAVKAYGEVCKKLNDNMQNRIRALSGLKDMDKNVKEEFIRDMIDSEPQKRFLGNNRTYRQI